MHAESAILKVVKDFYKGQETKKKSLLKLHPDMMYISRGKRYLSPEDFLEARWIFSGQPYLNKEFVLSGNVVCVKYELEMPHGSSSYCDWVTVEDGMVAIVEVFYGT